jgi:hypothetical protein
MHEKQQSALGDTTSSYRTDGAAGHHKRTDPSWKPHGTTGFSGEMYTMASAVGALTLQ